MPITAERFKKIEVGIVFLLLIHASGLTFPGALDNLWDKGVKLTGYTSIPILFFLNRTKVFKVIVNNIPLLCLTGFALSSIVWSVTPGETADFSRALIRTTLFGVYLATRFSLKEQMKLMAYTLGLLVILSIIFSIVIPSQGLQVYEGDLVWRGAFSHKNSMARMMTVAILLFTSTFITDRKNRQISGILLALAGILLIMSKGTTALVMSLLGMMLFPFFLFLRNHYKLRTVLIISGIIIVSTLSVLFIVNIETIIVDILGKSLTLTGRDELWAASLYKAYQKPLFGYGYGAFWTNPSENYFIDSQTWTSNPTHAHNGFIDLFLDLGMIGLILFLISFSLCLYRILRFLVLTSKIEYFYTLVFLTITTVFNFTLIGTILDEGHVFWILYISTAFSGMREYENLRANSLQYGHSHAPQIVAEIK